MPMIDTNSGIANSTFNSSTSFSVSEVWIIVSIVLAVIGGIFIYNNYLKKDESEYTGFKRKLYDFFTFKTTLIEPLLKIIYIMTFIGTTLCSFSYLTTNFFQFISILVLGNIIARLVFEFLLLTLNLFKDVREIKLNQQMKVKKNQTKEIEK